MERSKSSLLWGWHSACLCIETICCYIELCRNADALLVHSIPSLTIWSSAVTDFPFTSHIRIYFKYWNLIFFLRFFKCFNYFICSMLLLLTWNMCIGALRRNGRHVRLTTFIVIDSDRIIFCTFSYNQISSYFLLSNWRNVQIYLKFRCLRYNLFLRTIAYTIAFGFYAWGLECFSFLFGGGKRWT